ncbi:MAG TPA: hypothetical protein VE136_14825 [Anaerolineales bacterium]|nr:hypothetical protein [Anaerolineales bacterium]
MTDMTSKKPPSRHAHRFDLKNLKRLILVLAVTSALAYWAMVSNNFGDKGVAPANGKGQIPESVPPAETGAQMVIDLPPMPTLIPTMDSSLVGQAMQPLPSQDPVSVPATSIQSPVKIFLGGAKPSTKKVTTVTVTRSSK